MFILNSQKEKEPFSFWKIVRSARNSGASLGLAKRVAEEIEKEIYPGVSTLEIHNRIKKLLKKENKKAGIRFNLKEGMRRMGPSGFPFEKYIKEVLDKNGFETKINLHPFGKCAVYEIDFLARKENTLYVGECKYHKFSGERVDLKVSLYNYARFLDIVNGNYFKEKNLSSLEIKPMLVTNTKFTSQAIRYSKCMGIELLGWKYPKNRGLEYFIEKEKLYPITILPSLRGYLKDIFFKNKIALASDLISYSSEKLIKRLGISKKSIYPLIREAEYLLGE